MHNKEIDQYLKLCKSSYENYFNPIIFSLVRVKLNAPDLFFPPSLSLSILLNSPLADYSYTFLPPESESSFDAFLLLWFLGRHARNRCMYSTSALAVRTCFEHIAGVNAWTYRT